MGDTLDKPVTEKATSCCETELYKVGSSSVQGWRKSMEDGHTQICSLEEDPSTPFFAVFDGHDRDLKGKGRKIAEYAETNLHKFIVKRPEYQNENTIVDAIQQGHLDLDAAMKEEDSLKDCIQWSGSTATSILIKNKKLYCANAGDSRAIACIEGKLTSLSFDSIPDTKKEYLRIKAAGSSVRNSRVDGNLAMSRALGDFGYKDNENKKPEEQAVIAFPDVHVKKITRKWEFVVIACDGIWNGMESVDVLRYVRERVGTGMEPKDICEEMINSRFKSDEKDNMTVLITCFLHGRPYSDLVKRCSNPK